MVNADQKEMEISDAKFQLRDANQAKLEARTMLHSFNEEQFKEVVDKGLKVTADVSMEAQDTIDEFYFRRYGLGVSVVIISLVAVSLYLYIKRLEKKKDLKA